jgi:hypothetical protein
LPPCRRKPQRGQLASTEKGILIACTYQWRECAGGILCAGRCDSRNGIDRSACLKHDDEKGNHLEP